MTDIDLSFDWDGKRIRIHGARLRTQADADTLLTALDIMRKLLPGAPVNEKAVAAPPEGEASPPAPPASPSTIPEAPKPLPEGGGQRAPTVKTRPAEAKTSDQEPSASEGSEGMQDRCESIPSPIPPSQAAQTGRAQEPATTSHAGGDAVASPATSSHASGKPGGRVSSPAPGTLGAKILALHNEHPELTAVEAAETLGAKRTSVSAYSTQLGIQWATAVQRRDGMGDKVAELHFKHRDWPASRIAEELDVVAPYVRATAQRKGLILPPESARSGSGRREAPTPAPTPERPPAAIRQPIAAMPSGSGSAIITKPIAKPKGTQFYLRNDAGEYLHCSCESMTGDRNYAWRGNEQHLAAVRRRFPLAQDLREQVIEKEQARLVA